MVVRKELTDYSALRLQIVNATAQKIIDGKFDRNLHDIFKPSKIKIDDVQAIILSMERKLRMLESIFYTYFDTEYDPSIIIQRNLSGGRKVIETEFHYSTRIIANKIEVNNHEVYEELILINFQSFILTVASMYENIVKLIEIFVKKITVHGKSKQPYQSVPFGLLLEYWHNLIELIYRRNDDFYDFIKDHESFLDKNLNQINQLRNRFIHGYSSNLKIEGSTYYVETLDGVKFPLISGGFLPPELKLDEFLKNIMENSQELSKDLLTLLKQKLSHHWTKIPM